MVQHTRDGWFWAYLVHLGYNMWCDRDLPAELGLTSAKPYLRFDDSLWGDLVPHMVAAGINVVILDLGEGVRYQSHPEIAVPDAWSPERLRREIAHLRALGIEVVPKLNFSTCHDAWLGPYARCVSTDLYYGVCRDLIAEVIDLFDRPRFFHLGMDEEGWEHQQHYAYVVIRQHDLWWHDLYFLIEQVEHGGSRPWVWADYLWQHPEEYWARMPATVLQSNWYYDDDFSIDAPEVRAYRDLEAHGFDQVPTASTWCKTGSLAATVAYCRREIAPARLKGFLQTVWRPTLEVYRQQHLEAIEQVKQVRYSNPGI